MVEARKGFLRVLEIFDHLSIRYMIGGSFASSAHGCYRLTNDIDIVADISERDIARLVLELGSDFYADVDTMRDAIRRGRPFNIIHFKSSFKFDIFPLTQDPYSAKQMERRIVQDVPFGEGESIRCSVATPEDTILAKLVWFRLGGEQSDQQWKDLRGIRAAQRSNLDVAYMHKWAVHLRVEDLLDRLLEEELK